jgi:hypothetical protein
VNVSCQTNFQKKGKKSLQSVSSQRQLCGHYADDYHYKIMKRQTNSPVQAHLIRSAFYVLLLLAVCVIPFALALVPVRLDHIASFIKDPDYRTM